MELRPTSRDYAFDPAFSARVAAVLTPPSFATPRQDSATSEKESAPKESLGSDAAQFNLLAARESAPLASLLSSGAAPSEGNLGRRDSGVSSSSSGLGLSRLALSGRARSVLADASALQEVPSSRGRSRVLVLKCWFTFLPW